MLGEFRRTCPASARPLSPPTPSGQRELAKLADYAAAVAAIMRDSVAGLRAVAAGRMSPLHQEAAGPTLT
jgi:hypothetical protein